MYAETIWKSNQPTLCESCNTVMHIFSECEEAGLDYYKTLVGVRSDNPYPHDKRIDATALLKFVGGRRLRLSIEAFYVAQDNYLGEIDATTAEDYRRVFKEILHQADYMASLVKLVSFSFQTCMEERRLDIPYWVWI